MAKDDRLYAKFTLDFPDSPKIMPLSVEAKWALVEMTIYSRRMMTDGFLSKGLALAKWGLEPCLELLGNDPIRPSLIEVENGYQIHDFAEHQSTRAEIEELTNKRKIAGRKGGQASAQAKAKQSRSKSNPETETQTETKEPTYVGSGARKRATRLDPKWNPDRSVIEEMSAECPGVDLRYEHKKFVDYWTAKSGQAATKVDWNATWRNWMRRAGESSTSSRSGLSGQKRTKREQTFIDAEMLKDNPNPDVLAQYGITPRTDLKAIQGGIA